MLMAPPEVSSKTAAKGKAAALPRAHEDEVQLESTFHNEMSESDVERVIDNIVEKEPTEDLQWARAKQLKADVEVMTRVCNNSRFADPGADRPVPRLGPPSKNSQKHFFKVRTYSNIHFVDGVTNQAFQKLYLAAQVEFFCVIFQGVPVRPPQ